MVQENLMYYKVKWNYLQGSTLALMF